MKRPHGLSYVHTKQMVHVARLAWQHGWAAGTAGNFSVASPQGVWMSPSGVCKGQLDAHRFLLLDQTGSCVRAGAWKASEEAPVHLGVYQMLGQTGCVVHVHPPSLVRLSRERDVLCFQGEELQKALGCEEASETLSMRVAPNPGRHDFYELQQNMKRWWCDQAQALIVAGHGIWAWGQNPQMAMNRVEAVEHLCSVSL